MSHNINTSGDDTDCTLSVMRRLTRPLINPPTEEELDAILMDPWPIRVAVSPTDYTTLNHWREQRHTKLFQSMLEWPDDGEGNDIQRPPSRPTAPRHPFFSFGDPLSPFLFNPSQDVGQCLRNLLFHQMASHQSLGHDVTLSSHEVGLFVATGDKFQDLEIASLNISPHFYLLRCHHDKDHHTLIIGYHTRKQSNQTSSTFHKLHMVSLHDDNLQLTTSILLKNLARILLCLKNFAIPLVARPEKLSLIRQRIQKVHDSDYICNIFNATVQNMIDVYGKIGDA
jgi:hypothetical protein